MKSTGETTAFFADSSKLHNQGKWLIQPYAFDQAVKAANTILEYHRPKAPIVEPKLPPNIAIAAVGKTKVGHPSIARTLAGAAYQHRHDSDRLQLKDLETGLEELEDDDVLGSFFAENFWGPLSEEERQYLAGIVTGETMHNPAVRASLRQQGLILDGRSPVGAFADWIRIGLAAGYLES